MESAEPLTDPRLSAALLNLYRSTDVDSYFVAGEDLVRRAMPTFHSLAALPCVGYAPMYLRTSLPVPDLTDYWGRFYRARPPLADIIMNAPGTRVAVLSKHVEEETLLSSDFYRDFMVTDGWRYSAGLLFWDGPRFRGQFSFIRTAEQGDYNEDEIRILESLYPHFDENARRLESLDQERLQRRSLEAALDATLEGRIVLDWKLHPIYRNSTAIEVCAVWKTGSRLSALGRRELARQFALPDEIAAACAQLLADFSEAVRQDTQRLRQWQTDLPHPTIAGLSARIRILETKGPLAVEPGLLIELSRLAPAGGSDRAWPVHTLTASERRVAEFAAGGDSNEQIATALGVSIHTVRAHLREIFSKLGMERRSQLRDAMRAD